MGTHPCGRRRCRTRGCCTVGVFGECDPPTGPPACSTRGVLTYNPVIASASRLHVDTGPPYRVDAQKPGSHQRQRAQPPLDTTLNHSPQGCATHVTPRPRNTLQQLFRLPSASTHRTTTCSHKSNKKKQADPPPQYVHCSHSKTTTSSRQHSQRARLRVHHDRLPVHPTPPGD